MPGIESKPIEPGEGLLFDFQFAGDGVCRLVTSSRLASQSPEYIAGAYSESAFLARAACDVWVDLLYSLEKEFGDWEECRPGCVPVLAARIAEESRLIVITKLKSLKELHRAEELLLGTARQLAQLLAKGKQ